MRYRPLGKTGLMVSVIGMGGVQLSSSSTDYAVRIVQRALDLGVTYIDTARDYGDSEIKIGLALKGQRKRSHVSTKTGAKTREDALAADQRVARAPADGLCRQPAPAWCGSIDDLNQRTGRGGALDALIQAKEQGMVRHIGCTSHIAATLQAALKRFDFENILVPLNIIERDPLAELIPLCHQKGVGVTIMKPLATGLLPGPLALKWLAGQPIATAVPGCTTIAEIEQNARVGHLPDFTLTAEEAAQVDTLHAEWHNRRCRLCGDCLPCPQGIEVAEELCSDDVYNHYRTMGPEAFAAFAWSRDLVAAATRAAARDHRPDRIVRSLRSMRAQVLLRLAGDGYAGGDAARHV